MTSLPQIDDTESGHSEFLQDVIDGLSQPQKSIPCKYFYDAKGSKLFERICETEDYYVTRSDLEVLKACASQVAHLVGPGCHIIEPGSGAGEKIRILLRAMTDVFQYTPLEISADALHASAARLAEEFPDIRIHPVVADFTADQDLSRVFENPAPGANLVFFPGSTISNFRRAHAGKFFDFATSLMQEGGYLLIGVDLVKPRDKLLAAYNDREGITEEFNKNLLHRINRELGGDFHVEAFEHEAIFNEAMSRIEMHLISKQEQTVTIGGQRFDIAAGETLHTENSYKYTLESFTELAAKSGLVSEHTWTDTREYFSYHLMRADKHGA